MDTQLNDWIFFGGLVMANIISPFVLKIGVWEGI
jgi:hypothetical protein